MIDKNSPCYGCYERTNAWGKGDCKRTCKDLQHYELEKQLNANQLIKKDK